MLSLLSGIHAMVAETKIKPEQFNKLSRLVYKESGIVLNANKFELLKARLAKRLRTLRLSSVTDYISLIDSDENEFINFIDVITTNHTFFFRENKHCEYMLSIMNNQSPLKIWSAASSSGEEAYSIAVQLLENGFTFSVFGSDISDSMLQIAARGIYSIDRVSAVPRPTLRRYFQKGKGKWEGYVKLKPEVMNHVSFGKFNLISDAPAETFDVIYCRNVMIYFDSITKQKVVDSLCRALKPGGYFFVGMSESLQGLNHNLTMVVPSGYRKT